MNVKRPFSKEKSNFWSNKETLQKATMQKRPRNLKRRSTKSENKAISEISLKNKKHQRRLLPYKTNLKSSYKKRMKNTSDSFKIKKEALIKLTDSSIKLILTTNCLKRKKNQTKFNSNLALKRLSTEKRC